MPGADLVYIPPTAFHFVVRVDGAPGDTSFQEVSGLEVEMQTEDVAEGGENRFVHRLPVRTRYSNLVLKRGVVTRPSPLGRWFNDALSLGPVRSGASRTVVVQLLDRSASPLIAWKVFGAWPLRWQHAPLDAMNNNLMIETAELGYQYFERVDVAAGGS